MNNGHYLVISVLLLVAAFFVSWGLTTAEFADEKVMSNRVVPSFPTFGFDNFFADINWIKLIQVRNPENVSENLQISRQKFDLLNRITALNPHMNLAYIQAIDLMFVKDADIKAKALDLFERGSRYNAGKTWKVDYCAAFTCRSIADDQTVKLDKERFINRGLQHLKEALQLPNCPRFIQRAQAHFIKNLDRPVDLVDMWITLYQSADTTYDRDTCYYNLKSTYQDSLKLIKVLESSTAPEDAILLKRLARKIEQAGDVLFRSCGHCPNVACPFMVQNDQFFVGQTGEKFCPACGTALKYPPNIVICPNNACRAVLENRTSFCPFCGTGIPKPEKVTAP
ncbi:MAG: zinc ribbon domain-containing protein [Planctomycetota bacterium]